MPKLPQVFNRYLIAAIIILGLIAGGVFYLVKFSRAKSVDCSQVPKVDNADVIRMEDGKFNPSDLTVSVCDTILFLNLDETNHRPHSADFDPGHDLPKFDYFQYQVTKIGTITFKDQLHPELKGKIIVNKRP